MVSVVILLCSMLSAGDSLESRIETLVFHVERLEAITVSESLLEEKETRLKKLLELLKQEIEDEEAFNELYYAVDAERQWLWKNAKDCPRLPIGQFEETDGYWQVAGEKLVLRIDRHTLAMTVQAFDHDWEFEPGDKFDLNFKRKHCGLGDAAVIEAASFNTGYSVGMTLVFSDFPELPGFELSITAYLIGTELIFDMAAQESTVPFLNLNWPKAMVTDNSPETLSVIPRMQGMLLPGNWAQAIEAKDLFNSRSFYMPWWGQIQDGGGVQVIVETTDDAGGSYKHPADGPTRIAPRWYGSLGEFRYQRTLRYIFDAAPSYVSMAKRYRRFVQEHGEFVSLHEKAARTPSLTEVIGRPVIHIGSLYHFVQEAQLFNKERIERNHNLQTFDQLREQLLTLKKNGLDAAYVHLDGWGFYGYDNGHPDVLPPGEIQGGWEGLKRFADTCSDIGYLFAVHDQYRDYYLNAVSFDDRMTVTRLDGSREEHSVWCGGPQTILSPRFAPEYVRRNHDRFASRGIDVRGAYLDVFAVVPLEESFQSATPVTRTECARYRRDCFDLLRARGYVVSSEEPADYLVASLDLVHHAPYPTYPNIGGGDACAVPVPLFSLVYHDSILIPWSMGEEGGWGIPNGDSGRLHCMLNAGLPYLSPHADTEQIQQTLEIAALAEHCTFLEMTRHEFLGEGYRHQKTTYSDGTTVVVDFDSGETAVDYGHKPR
ncbi:MAG: hypothetical protein KAH38_05240 [Candidatus Hydrogenedentes bacterium]|nr:hypothetical protein [Candidatus Hydrogenedentota bacterium]